MTKGVPTALPRSIPETDAFSGARSLVNKGSPYVVFLRARGDVLKMVNVADILRRAPKNP